jgi:hypothetical protein
MLQSLSARSKCELKTLQRNERRKIKINFFEVSRARLPLLLLVVIIF